MVRITYRTKQSEEVADVEEGNSVMEGALFGGVAGIEGLCGGTISCGTCHIHVDEAWFTLVGKPGESEAVLLESLDNYKPTSRLGCQIKVTNEFDGLVVEVAA